MTDKVAVTGGIVPGLIVRHTSRRLGKLGVCEACGRLVEGKISFSEFVDQVGDGFREVLDFMMEYDLHPGRPEDVLFAVECHAAPAQRQVLLTQFGEIHENALHLKAG